jgi:hypothetical protein
MADPMQKTGAIITHELAVMRKHKALNLIVRWIRPAARD